MSGCTKLTSITIPDSVVSIAAEAFRNCRSLAKIDIPDGVTVIKPQTFFGCSGLTAVVLPGSVTRIQNYAFANCTSMTSISMPNVTVIDEYAFRGCSGLNGVILNPKLNYLNYGVFYSCTSLTSIQIPDGVTCIDNEAFARCSSLVTITIPDSVTAIGQGAFELCTGLVGVTFEDDPNVPDKETIIHARAFDRCSALVYAVLPKELTMIDTHAFGRCDALERVIFTGSDAPKFGSAVFYYGFVELYYPSGNEESWAERKEEKQGAFEIEWIAYNKTPTGLASTNVAVSGYPKLVWGKVPGAKSYQIYRSGAKKGSYKLVKTSTGTSYTDTSCEAGKAYYYKVKVVNKNGTTSEFSNVKSVTCDLKQPKVTTANDAVTGKPVLNWNAVDGAVKYKVYRSTSRYGEYTLLETVTDTTYTNANAKAGVRYYYKVVAVASKAAANSAPSKIVTRICDLVQPVVKASNVLATGKVKLTWKAVKGAVGYKVYRSPEKNGKYTLMKTVTGTTYTNLNAKAGVLYYYKVMAVAADSNANSTMSAVVQRTGDLARPVVSVSNAESGKPVLTWKAIPGAVKYKVFRSREKDGAYGLMKTVTGTTYTNLNAKAGQTYYYKVVAVCSNANGNSARSLAVKGACKLAAPVVSAELNDNCKPVLSWSVVPGAVKYQIWRCTTENGKYGLMKTVTNTTYTNLNAVEGKTYYYKVVAVGANIAANSVACVPVSITCVPSRKEDEPLEKPLVTAAISEDGFAVLSWDVVDGAVGYEVHRENDQGEMELIATVTEPGYSDGDILPGWSFTYQVTAIADDSARNATSERITVEFPVGENMTPFA